MRVQSLVAVAALAMILCGTAMAQEATPPLAPPQDMPGRSGANGEGRAFHGVGGQITAIEGSMVTLQTFSGGSVKIKITPATRVMKDRNEAKLSDFKVGDRVFAAGEQDKDGVWISRGFGRRSDGGGFPRGGGQRGVIAKPEDNGKSYIAGVVTKLEGTKLTVRKPDDTEQVIEVDDDTSFRNERHESVTLSDMKAGEFVHGPGVVKNGVFVPKELNAGTPRRLRPGAVPAGQVNPAPNQNQAAPDAGGEKR